MYIELMSIAKMFLLVQVFWVVDGSTTEKRSTASESEIGILRGLVAKIVNETEATRMSVSATNAKIDTTNSKIDAQTATFTNRIDVLSIATQNQPQCDTMLDSYDRYTKLDCTGHDIYHKTGFTLYECHSYCNVLKTCKAFYFDDSTSKCWVKFKCDLSDLRSFQGDTYVRRAISYYDNVKGFDCPGNNVKIVQNSNPEKCTRECDNDVLCIGVVMHIPNNQCSLKSKCQAVDFVRNTQDDIFLHRERDGIPDFVRKSNHDCDGSVIGSDRIDAKNCAKECQRKTECVAFAFHPATSNCEYKSSCDTNRHYWSQEEVLYLKS